MSTRLPDPNRSRVVLIGTPRYTDPGLPNVPVIADNITDLAAALTDPAVSGFNPATCLAAPSNAGLAQIGQLLTQAAEEAEDLLLVYYSGHGLLSPRNRDLYLSLADTRRGQLAFTALPFHAVRDACLDSRAANRVVILDCCYSGRAIGETLTEDAVLGQLDVAGTFTLTAAPANRAALILPEEAHTAFTERLLHVLRYGIPTAGEVLSLGTIYRELLARTRAEGLPEPQQRGTATADLLGLARNAAWNPSASVDPTPELETQPIGMKRRYPRLWESASHELGSWLTDPQRVSAARIVMAEANAVDVSTANDGPDTEPGPDSTVINLARRVALAINDPQSRAYALIEVAESLDLDSPERVENLLTAWRGADDIRDGERRDFTRAYVVRSLSFVDLEQAELLAEDIKQEQAKSFALRWIVRRLSETDLDRAEQVAERISDGSEKAMALHWVARKLVETDPDRAFHVIRTIGPSHERSRALSSAATALAETDPDTAERVAASISDGEDQRRMLKAIAVTVAHGDPARAERIALGIEDAANRVEAFTSIWEALAEDSPEEAEPFLAAAERIAAGITKEPPKSRALASIVTTVAGQDPKRAEHLAARIRDDSARSWAQARVVSMLSRADPDEAERIAAGIVVDAAKNSALAQIAYRLSLTDPDRAVRVAEEISDAAKSEEALRQVAEALAGTDGEKAESIAAAIGNEYVRSLALIHIRAHGRHRY